MEAVIFALIGTRNEKFVPVPVEFRSFDLPAADTSIQAEGM
jgi:hypothetical protein